MISKTTACKCPPIGEAARVGCKRVVHGLNFLFGALGSPSKFGDEEGESGAVLLGSSAPFFLFG